MELSGKNLTRQEAARRACLLSVSSYQVSLDLGNATDVQAGTFGSTSTILFTCAEPGAWTFVDPIAPAVRSVTLNGRKLDPAEVFADSRVKNSQNSMSLCSSASPAANEPYISAASSSPSAVHTSRTRWISSS